MSFSRHGAPVARAMRSMTAPAASNGSTRSVNGPAYGSPILPAIHALLQSTTKSAPSDESEGDRRAAMTAFMECVPSSLKSAIVSAAGPPLQRSFGIPRMRIAHANPLDEALLAELARALDDPRHQAVLDRLFGAHPEVALHVAEHLRQRLAGLPGDDLGDALARAQNFLRLDRDVGRRAAGAAARLMDHEARVRQADAPLPGRGEEDVRAGARHPAGAHGGHRRPHEPDDVVDRVAGFDVAAGRRNEDGDRPLGFLRQRDEARAGRAGDRVVDLAEQHDEARLEGQAIGDRLDAFGGFGLFFVDVHRMLLAGSAPMVQRGYLWNTERNLPGARSCCSTAAGRTAPASSA